ncbi:MAG: D-hexose-6-phosphate mutarotase [Lentisphaeria bacterium]|nr:D-hexose-6-phosphate mutarotase [Lentisphaeria bacterium]
MMTILHGGYKMNIDELSVKFGGNGISFEEYHGFPAVRMENEFSSTLVSVYGGHVIEFKLPDSEDVLWMSAKSLFEQGSPMRGGVPVCFPWFGAAPEGKSGSHGCVRNAMWDVAAAGIAPEGGNFVTLYFDGGDFELYYTVTANHTLTLSLEVNNPGVADFHFGGALHTYFNISDAGNVVVEDLDGVSYLDTVVNENGIQNGALKIDREIDRMFRSCGSVRIVDPGFKRIIHIDKYGSDSTVVWNPWIDKSRRMPDFGDEEYHTMLCVEAGKVPRIGDGGTVHSGVPFELRQVIRVELTD